MAIKRLFWNPETNRDIHLLRGTTSRSLITHGLRVRDEAGDEVSASDYLLVTPNDRIVFRPQFRNQGPPAGDYLNTDIGVRVDSKTGAVTATAPQSHVKNNFVIEIQAENHDGTLSNVESIRVHVHNSVVEAWLTPDHLTVRPRGSDRPELTEFRFTVRARFDTSVVADLTLIDGLQWSPASNVLPSGHLKLDTADFPDKDIPITATLPADLGGAVTPAVTLRVRASWDTEPKLPKAVIVVGSAWPRPVQPNPVPNVLILGDGFRAGDKRDFLGIADKVVQHLKTDKLTRPFDLLSTSMNFWKVFWPSDTLGISVRSEVYTYLDGSQTWAVALPTSAKPPASGGWTMEHLLYAAGLPVPADKNRADTAIKQEWDATLETGAWPPNAVKLIDDWKRMGDRTLLEELDAFPGMSYGYSPAADSDDNTELDLHPDRGGTEALKAFFNALTADNSVTTAAGKPIGDLWVTKDFTLYDFDNTGLVLLLSALNGGRARNSGSYIALSRGAEGVLFPVKQAGNRWLLDLQDPPNRVTADRCRTAAHELGHSFGLGDEYVNFDDDYPGTEKDLESFANLQIESSARDASGNISGAEIKWNWHRIKKAAVIAGDIRADPAGGGRFIVPLELEQAMQFQKGDKVTLRVRQFGKPLQKGQKTLDKQIEISESPVVDAVEIKAFTGPDLTPDDVADYKRGSILYTPAPLFPLPGAIWPFARLVAPNIQDSITNRKRPLTAVPCKPDRGDVQSPDLTGVTLPGFLCFKHKTRIVGLYSGGARWACGIFHPAGACVMRNEHDGHTEFCAVCRYVLVDFVNPFRHFEIDRDYAEIYPQA